MELHWVAGASFAAVILGILIAKRTFLRTQRQLTQVDLSGVETRVIAELARRRMQLLSTRNTLRKRTGGWSGAVSRQGRVS